MAKDQFGFGVEQDKTDANFFTRLLHSQVAGTAIFGGQAALAYPIFSDVRRPEYSSTVKELEKIARKMGVNVTSLDVSKNPFESLINPLKGSYYNPANKEIQIAQRGKNMNPGILSHELGHAKQNRKSLLTKASKFGRYSQAMNLPLMLTDDEDTAKLFAGAGSAIAAPQFIHEMDASVKGRKLLLDAAKKSGNKLGFIRSLGSFKGLPTYALSLIAPFLMYKYLKYQDQYKKSKEN
tara:strand:- start:44 stop:754 length:711 start_codon:yes stop_codon:yes gene_type:complete